jgi:uncharacterized protein (UPF0332 family)
VTGANRRLNAEDELERAEVCLREAEKLHDAELPFGAASRAYYAVFHAARALLFSVGVEARTHQGTVSLLGEHFVKVGKLSSEMGRLLSRMQRDREDADYGTGAVFTDVESEKLIADARRFVAEVLRLIPDASPATRT